MKFAKHLAKAMNVSDPEWNPFWVNYKHLKRLLKPSTARATNNTTSTTTAATGDDIGNNLEETKRQLLRQQEAAARAAVGLLTRQRSGDDDSLVDEAHTPRGIVKQDTSLLQPATAPTTSEPSPAASKIWRAANLRAAHNSPDNPQERKTKFQAKEPAIRSRPVFTAGIGGAPSSASGKLPPAAATSHPGGRIAVLSCPSCTSSCAIAATAAAAAAATAAGAGAAGATACPEGEGAAEVPAVDPRRHASAKCPFFDALLREIDMCRAFFLQNEAELKVRTQCRYDIATVLVVSSSASNNGNSSIIGRYVRWYFYSVILITTPVS